MPSWLADLGLAAKTRPLIIVYRFDPDASHVCSDAGVVEQEGPEDNIARYASDCRYTLAFGFKLSAAVRHECRRVLAESAILAALRSRQNCRNWLGLWCRTN
jgi:hypothetical protein